MSRARRARRVARHPRRVRSLRPIDSHCHLADEAFKADIIDVVLAGPGGRRRRRRSASSTPARPRSCARARGLRELWPSVRFAVGVHPHARRQLSRRPAGARPGPSRRRSRPLPDACAIGEMGLDYHYDFATPRASSRRCSRRRSKLARDAPAAGHRPHPRSRPRTRSASCKDSGKGEVRGVFHCFTGDAALAAAALELGFYLSFSGIVSFPKSDALRAVAAHGPGRPAADRDRQPVPGAGAASRQAERAGPGRPRGRGARPRPGGRPPAAIVEQTAAQLRRAVRQDVTRRLARDQRRAVTAR